MFTGIAGIIHVLYLHTPRNNAAKRLGLFDRNMLKVLDFYLFVLKRFPKGWILNKENTDTEKQKPECIFLVTAF